MSFREIKSLNTLVEAILADLNQRTGWTFLILAGGPDPSTGKIRTRSYNKGENVQGHTFANSFQGFDEKYVKPFASFLKQVYRK